MKRRRERIFEVGIFVPVACSHVLGQDAASAAAPMHSRQQATKLLSRTSTLEMEVERCWIIRPSCNAWAPTFLVSSTCSARGGAAARRASLASSAVQGHGPPNMLDMPAGDCVSKSMHARDRSPSTQGWPTFHADGGLHLRRCRTFCRTTRCLSPQSTQPRAHVEEAGLPLLRCSRCRPAHREVGTGPTRPDPLGPYLQPPRRMHHPIYIHFFHTMTLGPVKAVSELVIPRLASSRTDRLSWRCDVHGLPSNPARPHGHQPGSIAARAPHLHAHHPLLESNIAVFGSADARLLAAQQDRHGARRAAAVWHAQTPGPPAEDRCQGHRDASIHEHASSCSSMYQQPCWSTMAGAALPGGNPCQAAHSLGGPGV